MEKLLPTIDSPADLKKLSIGQLEQLAGEMREALCNLLSSRSAHFASNLGVVELCLALHTTFDFRRDRLIWDTGHQIYPHKLITGRYHEFTSIRTKGGLMGYPNPAESEYDLFMTGHAGCSLSTALGLKSGDDLVPGQSDRRAVAVIGDGAFPSGIVSEAMNNAGGLRKQLLVVLNDNQMSICPRVGGLGEYLDRLRMNTFYTGLKTKVLTVLDKVPLVGDPMERWLAQMKEAVKAGLHGGMLFEQLGFRYLGPIDGHNIAQLSKYLNLVKNVPGPVLLHVITQKGHGFQPAAADPVYFHTPAPFQRDDGGTVVAFQKGGSRAYTDVASEAIHRQMTVEPEGHGDDGRHVPGDQAGAGAGGLSRTVFRHRHLRIAHRGLRRRPGQGRPAADRQHLQHLPATQLRSDLPGSGFAEPAGHVPVGPCRAGRRRWAHASRHFRPGLHAAVPEYGRGGAR